MKHKLFTLILVLPLMLLGCSGNEDAGNGIDTAGKKTYQTANFSINYPQDWEIIEKNKFSSSVPKDIVVGFRSNIKNEIFTANVNIGVSILDQDLSSKDFGISTMAKASHRLIEFSELSAIQDSVNSTNGLLDAYVVQFEGKKTPSDPLVHFTQLFASSNGVVYTLTSAYLPDEDEMIVKQGVEMLNSFTLK